MKSFAPDRRAQGGASLIEIMIALVLGLMLTAGMFQIYLSSKQSYRMQDALSLRQENLRYASLLLTRDLRMAGYRGCLRDTGQVKNTLNTPTDFLYNFGLHVQGFEATSGSAWTPALHSSLTPVTGGTDVLTLRTTLDPGVFITQSMPTSSAVLKVQDNLSPPPFIADGGDIVLVTDCGGAAIFQITRYTAANGNIVHNPGSGAGLPTPGNATQDLGRRFEIGSELLKLSTISYFIRDSANGTGPALWRRINLNAAEELVEGIENMQVQYGEDTDGDAVPDAYRTANSVVNWRNVNTVRVALLAVGVGESQTSLSDSRQYILLDRTVGPFNDKRLRRVVTVTISLRNRLP